MVMEGAVTSEDLYERLNHSNDFNWKHAGISAKISMKSIVEAIRRLPRKPRNQLQYGYCSHAPCSILMEHGGISVHEDLSSQL